MPRYGVFSAGGSMQLTMHSSCRFPTLTSSKLAVLTGM
jgi:hypothetical protein